MSVQCHVADAFEVQRRGVVETALALSLERIAVHPREDAGMPRVYGLDLMQDRQLDNMFRRALGREVPCAPKGLHGDYVVVDSARDARIHELATATRVESTCLYDGALGPELARVAPYLVRLELGSRFAAAFYEAGWNHAWGIVLRASVGLSELRRHLRTLAYVRRENGVRLLFRYYDPRVLRSFLPTCDRGQLEQVFGPIGAFVLDAAEASAAQVLSRTETGELSVREHRS